MTRAEILQEITRAKIAHKRWIKRADHLISGLPVEKEFIPLAATSCGFGKWLYGQGTSLREIDNTRHIMEEIEVHHDDVHDTYSEIYKIFFIIPESKSFFSKVFTFNSKNVNKKGKEQAELYFEQLRKSSDELLKLLEKLEQETIHITYEQLLNTK